MVCWFTLGICKYLVYPYGFGPLPLSLLRNSSSSSSRMQRFAIGNSAKKNIAEVTLQERLISSDIFECSETREVFRKSQVWTGKSSTSRKFSWACRHSDRCCHWCVHRGSFPLSHAQNHHDFADQFSCDQQPPTIPPLRHVHCHDTN